MQNYRTKSVGLSQRLYEASRAFPAYPPYPGRRGFLAREYRVVDLALRDGRALAAHLLISDDVLVHEDEPDFAPEEIVAMTPTPPERHPDFTVTDEDAPYQRGGIEQGNAQRLGLFGPPRVERDWRAAPPEEAHAEALHVDERIETWDGELPATEHGPDGLRLVPGGIELSVWLTSAGRTDTRVVRPRGARLWSALLHQEFELDPAFTLRHLLALLDLPPGVGREVYHRTVPWAGDGFTPWVRWLDPAVHAADGCEGATTEIEALVVQPTAHLADGAYAFGWDAYGLGRPPVGTPDASPEASDDAGSSSTRREHYALDWTGPATLLDCPLRYDPTLELPVPHEETMAYYRGTLRDWELDKRPSPRPEPPVAFRTRRTIHLGEFIGAVFAELGWREVDPREVLGD